MKSLIILILYLNILFINCVNLNDRFVEPRGAFECPGKKNLPARVLVHFNLFNRSTYLVNYDLTFDYEPPPKLDNYYGFEKSSYSSLGFIILILFFL